MVSYTTDVAADGVACHTSVTPVAVTEAEALVPPPPGGRRATARRSHSPKTPPGDKPGTSATGARSRRAARGGLTTGRARA